MTAIKLKNVNLQANAEIVKGDITLLFATGNLIDQDLTKLRLKRIKLLLYTSKKKRQQMSPPLRPSFRKEKVCMQQYYQQQ
jgi:hypothetical protein